MQIHIKKLDGQKEEFSLEPNDSVMKVKVSGKEDADRVRSLNDSREPAVVAHSSCDALTLWFYV